MVDLSFASITDFIIDLSFSYTLYSGLTFKKDAITFLRNMIFDHVNTVFA